MKQRGATGEQFAMEIAIHHLRDIDETSYGVNSDSRQFILAENPDALAEPAFQFVEITDRSFTPNPNASRIIRAALESTGVADERSTMVAGFLDNGSVGRAGRAALGELYQNPDYVDVLSRSVLMQCLIDQDYPNSPRNPDQNYGAVWWSLATVNWQSCKVVNRDGHEATINGHGETEPSVVYDRELSRGTSRVSKLAADLSLNGFVEQYPLQWIHDGEKTRPKLLASQPHLTLGRVARDGSFEPVVTVLSYPESQEHDA